MNTIKAELEATAPITASAYCFLDFPTQNQLSIELPNSQKGIVRITSLSYLAERGRLICARLQFDSCLVPYMDRRCLLTDLPICHHLPNDKLLGMTSTHKRELLELPLFVI